MRYIIVTIIRKGLLKTFKDCRLSPNRLTWPRTIRGELGGLGKCCLYLPGMCQSCRACGCLALKVGLTKGNVLMEDQKVWVIVPVKTLVEAKSRLAPVLTTAQRRNLAFQMAGHTLCVLQTLSRKGLIAGFVTVSRDPVVRTLTQKYGGVFLPEKISGTSPDAALNTALSQAARWTAASFSPDALLILHSDLPFLRWEDLANLLRQAQNQPGKELALLSPDRHGSGTNSLFLRPPAFLNFEFLFGENSLNRYQDFIKGKGLEPAVYPLPNLGFDLDYPEDLAAISRPFSGLNLQNDCPAI